MSYYSGAGAQAEDYVTKLFMLVLFTTHLKLDPLISVKVPREKRHSAFVFQMQCSCPYLSEGKLKVHFLKFGHL